MDPKTYRYADMALLHPICRNRFKALESALKLANFNKQTRTLFLAFETYRHPLRQAWLKETTKNTKAGPFESSHNFGLAVDFVPFDVERNKWSWADDEDWDFLKETAMAHGLIVPISWDRPHVESPVWGYVRAELKTSSGPSRKNLAEQAAIWAEHDARVKGA